MNNIPVKKMESTANGGYVNILQLMDWRFHQIMQMICVNSRNLNSMLSYNLEQLNSAVRKINDDIETMKRTSDRDRAEIKRATEDITDLHENCELINERLDKLEELVDMNEADLKSCNLRFMGVPEGGTHSFPAIDVILDILNQYSYERSWSHRDINKAFRVGEWRDFTDNPRPIVVQMHRWSDKMAILQDQDLREALREDNIRVAAELTTSQRGMVDFHTKQGKRAYYWKGKLQVEEKQQRFDQSSFPVFEYDRRPFHYQRRGPQHFHGGWPATNSFKNDGYSTRSGRQGTASSAKVDKRGNDEIRVAPGHRTYSQVVKEGRHARGPAADDRHTLRNPTYWEKRSKENSTDKNTDKTQRSLNHVPAGAEHRRIILKVGEEKLLHPGRSRQSVPHQRTSRTEAECLQEVRRAHVTDKVYSGTSGTNSRRETVATGILTRQQSDEREASNQLQSDQLSDGHSVSDADPSSGVEEEEQDINPGEPQRDHLLADTFPDHEEPPQHHVAGEDLSPEGETARQLSQEDVSTEASGTPVAVTGPEEGAVNPGRQSDRTGVIQGEAVAVAEDQSLLDTATGQPVTVGEEAASGEESDNRSRPKTKVTVKEQRPNRMTTRAGSTKQRSWSQGSIRDALKRTSVGGGSLNSGKGRDEQSCAGNKR